MSQLAPGRLVLGGRAAIRRPGVRSDRRGGGHEEARKFQSLPWLPLPLEFTDMESQFSSPDPEPAHPHLPIFTGNTPVL